jgi:hypothetical protein
MKYFAAAMFALVCLGASAAPPPQTTPVDLRQTLQQYHAGSSAAPRQLTPVERAELRRQLAQNVQAPRRR